jgi:O-antigen ligase
MTLKSRASGITAFLFAATLGYGLWRYGAAQTDALYTLFLALVPLGSVAVAGLPLTGEKGRRHVFVLLLGGLISTQLVLQPTLRGAGYVHLSIAWLTLAIVLWLVGAEQKASRWLFTAVVTAAVAEALYGILQSLGGVDYIGSYYRQLGRIATGTLINRNHYAGLLNMGLALAIGRLLTRGSSAGSDHRSRSETLALSWLLLLGCVLMGLAILLSLSRAGTLTMALTLLFIAAFHASGGHRGKHLHRVTPWVVLAMILTLGTAVGLEPLTERFGRLENDVARAEVYADTLRLIKENPLTGVGPGMYRWRFRPYQTVAASVWYDHAHNDYLETAAEWGVPIAALVWGFVGWRCYQSARRYLKETEPWRKGLALGCAAAIFSILIHSLVDFNLQVPSNLMVLALVVGLAWSLESDSAERV